MYSCELEMLRYPEGFVVRKLFRIRKTPNRNLYIVYFYVYCMYWSCILWRTSVNVASLNSSGH
jgi:hypothetical protein